MARSQYRYDAATDTEYKFDPDSGWQVVDPLAERQGPARTALIQAGGEFARIGRGVEQIFAGDERAAQLGETNAEDVRILGGLSEANPVSSFVGRMAPYLATLPVGSGVGASRLGATALGRQIGRGGVWEQVALGAVEGAAPYQTDALERITGAALGAGGAAAGGLLGRQAGRYAARRTARQAPPAADVSLAGRFDVERGPIDAARVGEDVATAGRQVDEATRAAGAGSVVRETRRRTLAEADELGFPVGLAQRTDIRPVEEAAESLRSFPMTANIGAVTERAQDQALSKRLAAAIGEPEGRALTPESFATSAERIGDTIDENLQRIGPIPARAVQRSADTAIGNIQQSVGRTTNPAEQILKNLRDLAVERADEAGNVSPQVLSEFRSQLVEELGSFKGQNLRPAARAVSEAIDLLDSAIERAGGRAGKEVRTSLRRARQQWRMLRTLEKVDPFNAGGDIAAKRVRNGIRREYNKYKPRYDRQDYSGLEPEIRDAIRTTRVAQQLAPTLGNSGSATRVSAQLLATSPIIGGAAALGGNILGRGEMAASRALGARALGTGRGGATSAYDAIAGAAIGRALAGGVGGF